MHFMELETFRPKIVRKKHRDRTQRERERVSEREFDTLILPALTCYVSGAEVDNNYIQERWKEPRQ